MSFPARPNSWLHSESPSGSPKRTSRIDPRRFYTALIVIPVLYAGISYSPPWLFSMFVAITVGLALREFLILYFKSRDESFVHLTCFLAAGGILFLLNGNLIPPFQWVGLGVTLGILSGFFLNPTSMRRLLPKWLAYAFGVLYVALLFGHFILLRQLPEGIALIFFVLIVTWLSDTGGYVFGIAFGRHPLAPVLSPKKTIEGFLGGILFSIAGALLCHAWFISFISLSHSIILGGLLAISGTLGDLTESAIKRSVQVKDSGTLIPGHGGVLDRIDSLLLSTPAFYYYAVFTGIGS